MPLFEMTDESLVALARTTFAAEQLMERGDLQRLLRANIHVVDSEDFGAFADARRRVDLLGVDREGRLVVFEP